MKSNTHELFLVIPGLFSEDECKSIIELTKAHTSEPAVVWDKGNFKSIDNIRKSNTAYIKRDKNSEWIYERMDLLFKKASEYWGFQIDGTEEDLKYVKYEEGDHFTKWHADIGPGYPNKRKLSMSIELNSKSEFEGGNLQIFPIESGSVHDNNSRRPGDAVVFPSFRHHRVTPVKKGTRHVLVNWASGPELR